MSEEKKYAQALNWKRSTVYKPKQSPGFAAWTTAFDYGDGSIGLVFKETVEEHNPDYREPKLEFSESVAMPVSYASVFWGSVKQRSYQVYMRSYDNGQTFAETGRALESVAAYANVGYPDGRIVGFDVAKANKEGTSWEHCIRVRESMDGGTTWRNTAKLLDGNGIYLWRVRRMQDGTIVLMACFYGSPWGPEFERSTRNSMLPNETSISKIQTFFMTSQNGIDFTGPHYILPGIGAHEYDFVELEKGTLLFIAGDVQATPVARQEVLFQNNRIINRPLYPILRGAPNDPQNPQSGFLPESIVALPNNIIVGSRRNKPYSCSADKGENWYEIDGIPASLYQPFMQLAPNGTILNFGHKGADNAFGQVDMEIGVDSFELKSCLPSPCRLKLSRCKSSDNSHYTNKYTALLTCNGKPLAGQAVVFRFMPYWNTEDDNKTASLENAAYTISSATTKDGLATAEVTPYDSAADIHFAYDIQASFAPPKDSPYSGAQSTTMSVSALRPHRNNAYPYDAYFAEGVLYLSPKILVEFPTATKMLKPYSRTKSAILPSDAIPKKLAEYLLGANVLVKDDIGTLKWRKSVHAPYPLDDILPMPEGDWFI